MRTPKRSRAFWITMTGLVLILSIIVILNVILIRSSESKNIDAEGQIELSNIAGNVENSLYRSECLLDSVIMQIEPILTDSDTAMNQLKQYFNAENLKKISEKSDGSCFSVYAAYKEELYINDFVPDNHFVLSEREWYIGAKKMMGKVNVTDPYIDANTGEMCYSISKLLSDGQTVVGMDFNMNELQKYIEEMTKTSNGTSLIVNEQGMILGHSNAEYIGKNYNEFPFYSELVNKVYMLYGDYFEYKADGVRYNVFSDKTNYDWYLIVCVKTDILQVGLGFGAISIIGLIIVLMLVILVFVYWLYNKKESSQTELQKQKTLLENIKSQVQKAISQIKNQADFLENDEISDIKLKTAAMESMAKLGIIMEQLAMQEEYLYSSTNRSKQKTNQKKKLSNVNYRRISLLITFILIATSIFAIIFNTNTQVEWGQTKMQKESDQYVYQVQEWIATNRATLTMIANSIMAQPGFEENYNSAITYLDDVVSHYDDISVAYLCNPDWEHTVLMNNGWEPDADWHVEERQWYIDTMASDNEISIAIPYLDEQTGLYCITLSKIVYDENGGFIGILGIDYYMDKLVDILGKSYTDTGYAFLTDVNGNILNHPYEQYQMTPDESQNAANLCYRSALAGDGSYIIHDYDGYYKVCQAVTAKELGFGIIVVRDISVIYGNAVISDFLYLFVFIICIIIIGFIMKKLSIWQLRVNLELEEAAEHAISAGKAKNDFLANMSHEIRTPINAVLGMNEMIMRESCEPAILEYAMNIQGAGRTLLSLINDILDFSKIESGKMEIIPAQYDVSSLINDLVQMIKLRAEKKNLEFLVEIDSHIPATLYGDDVRIRQIITNILTNAVKYTAQGSIKLHISLLEIQNQTALLKISVADTGMGIREEDLDKLFQSFQRLEQEKNRNIEGTGLGISIVQKLLQMMDSHLDVSSVYGAGSTFSFVLSQGIVNDEIIGNYEVRFKESASLPSDEIHRTASEAHILVVDDNDTNLLVAKSLLKRTKVQTDTVTSGKACLELLRTKSYHIVFLDHMMPEMDGIETLAEIKKENLAKGTIFVALTANAIHGAKETYLASGFDDYLSKPISGKNLEKCLFQYIPSELIEEESDEHGSEETTADSSMSVMNEEEQEYINLKTGLMYTGENLADYQEILRGYVLRGEKNLHHIQELYDAEQWKEYVIAVHALKSSSLSIGAQKLSDQAKHLELEGKDENYQYITSNHHLMMDTYVHVLDAGKTYLMRCTQKEPEKPSALETPASEEVVPTREELLELLSKLKDACDSFFSDDVLQVCEELQSCHSYSEELSPFLNEIQKYADDFNFEEALARTEQFMQTLK